MHKKPKDTKQNKQTILKQHTADSANIYKCSQWSLHNSYRISELTGTLAHIWLVADFWWYDSTDIVTSKGNAV